MILAKHNKTKVKKKAIGVIISHILEWLVLKKVQMIIKL